MQRARLPARPIHRPSPWLAVALLAAVLGAQWLTLRHAHAGDGLAPECQVCEQAPAFAHGIAPEAPALAPAAAPPPAARAAALPAGRCAPTPKARGPPAPVQPALHS